MKNKIIIPQKPILFPDFRCYTNLKKSEVDIKDIKDRAKKEGYREQTERHITIIGRTGSCVIRKLLSKLTPKEKSQIIEEIKKIINKLGWQFAPQEIYHVSQHDRLDKNGIVSKRGSYIRVVKMPAAKNFHQKIKNLFQTNIPTHCFPHITLFTRGEEPNSKYYGISIRSKEIFNKLHPKKIK